MKLPGFGIEGSNFLSASPLPEKDLRFEAIAPFISARVSSGRVVGIVFDPTCHCCADGDFLVSPSLSMPANCGRSGETVCDAACTPERDPPLGGVPIVLGVASSSLSNSPPPSRSSIAADLSAAGVFGDARCAAAALIDTPTKLSASSSVRSRTSTPSSSSESASSDCFGACCKGAGGPVRIGAYSTLCSLDVFG